MTARNTVRLLVTLGAALCVVTMFAGSAAAVDLGAVSVDDGGDDAAVDIDTGLDTEADQSGGGGSGNVAVDTDQGGAEGAGAVEGDVQNQSVTVAASGEGGPAGNEVGGGVECELSPDSAQNPQEACEFDTPGGDNPLPEDPGGDLPIDPGGNLPLPVDGLQSL